MKIDEVDDDQVHQQKSNENLRKILLRMNKAVYNPNYEVQESVQVDYYGTLRLPTELRFSEYEDDIMSFKKVTGWDCIDNF